MLKVLVIDDDRVNRRMLSRAIEELGHPCIESGNGKHAWEVLTENDGIQLVVSDLIMPDMDGRQLLKLIRGEERFKSLQVILVSGILSETEVFPLKQLSPDCTTFLSKPVNLREFRETVKRALR